MHLTLHLTRGCNMRCRYCYAPPADDHPMSLDIGRAALALGARLSPNHSCGIVFFGGEPLLHRDLLLNLVSAGQSMQRSGLARFHYKITTNGLLLDNSFLAAAVANDITIAMSFDGIRKAHDAHRRRADGSGTFDVLFPNLRSLLHAKPYSNIIMVVNPDTAHHMAESVEFLFDSGVRYLIMALNYAADWQAEHLETLRRQYTRLAARYARWTFAGRKFYFSPLEVKLSSHINQDRFDAERCDLGRRQLSVDPFGYLYPCVQFVRAGHDSRWCVGHVATGIDSARADALNAESKQDKPQCARCDLRPRCGHTCACLNWQTTAGITTVSPILCEHEKMLIDLADRLGNLLYRRQSPLFIQKHYDPAYPLLSLIEDTPS